MNATIHQLKPRMPEADVLSKTETDVVRELETAFVSGLVRGSQHWRLQALCARDPQPDDWFAPPRIAAHRRALAICQSCPVRSECLDDAVACRTTEGIRGGVTGEEIGLRLTHREDQPRFDQIKAALLGALVRLTDAEKRAVVRIAELAGIGWEVWAPAMGIGYKAATKRRRNANSELANIPERDRIEEIALADELRQHQQEFAPVVLAVAA
ncbi:WhiB family transcriptional regulator [Kitasatospora sp. NA04385]|uniref:WhiB family transcriptional regulator n=1 Tax=Kitasatospora sp. NA04385 TaxID=2742135 RepID=UPI001591D361|nr:WhiB family transcriptional regulator [Kitasatospora sp. NA04385]QKW20592.1 WhiB family transcriptional regulator [Kitasatospora sp. NA04385]